MRPAPSERAGMLGCRTVQTEMMSTRELEYRMSIVPRWGGEGTHPNRSTARVSNASLMVQFRVAIVSTLDLRTTQVCGTIQKGHCRVDLTSAEPGVFVLSASIYLVYPPSRHGGKLMPSSIALRSLQIALVSHLNAHMGSSLLRADAFVVGIAKLPEGHKLVWMCAIFGLI